MAADYAAQPSDGRQPDDDRLRASTRLERAASDTGSESDTGEEHDLTYLRTRRARAHDPRRSLSAAFGDRPDAPDTHAPNVVALRRAAPVPAQAAEPEPAPRPLLLGRSRGFWILSATLFALVAGATFGVFYSRQTWAERAVVAPEVIHAPAAAASPSGLRMHVEVQGERVLVSWDPQASGVQDATGGMLTIEDAGQHNEFALDAMQATNGSVLYRPASGDVTFRLQIRNASGAVYNDSLRVLDPAKRALVAQEKAAGGPQTGNHSIDVKGPPAERPKVEIMTHRPGKATQSSRSGRLIAHRSAPRQASRTASTADPLARMPAAAPVTLPPAQAVAGAALPPEFAERALGSGTAPASETRGGTTGVVIGTVSAAHTDSNDSGDAAGIFLAPQPVKQVMPTLRSSLLSAIPPGAKVGVVVSIDTHGRVKRAEIAPASKSVDIGVQKAAIDAAKQWKFAPAWRNGKKVDAEDTIYFQF